MFKKIATIFTSYCEFADARNEKFSAIVCNERPIYVKNA